AARLLDRCLPRRHPGATARLPHIRRLLIPIDSSLAASPRDCSVPRNLEDSSRCCAAPSLLAIPSADRPLLDRNSPVAPAAISGTFRRSTDCPPLSESLDDSDSSDSRPNCRRYTAG